MQLIPAIDLKQGHVVYACGYQRQQYQPLCTEKFPDSLPLQVITQLMDMFSPHIIYIADIDAIQKVGDNCATISQIHHCFPTLGIWLDSGIRYATELTTAERITPIVGSETLCDDLVRFNGYDYILSLDFYDDAVIGRDVFADNTHWTQTVIALALDAVGTQQGPHIKQLQALRKRHSGRLIAGGGVRGQDDLEELEHIGMDGVLVASAIYHGHIGAK